MRFICAMLANLIPRLLIPIACALVLAIQVNVQKDADHFLFYMIYLPLLVIAMNVPAEVLETLTKGQNLSVSLMLAS